MDPGNLDPDNLDLAAPNATITVPVRLWVQLLTDSQKRQEHLQTILANLNRIRDNNLAALADAAERIRSAVGLAEEKTSEARRSKGETVQVARALREVLASCTVNDPAEMTEERARRVKRAFLHAREVLRLLNLPN